jgi:hypothetical protein
MTTIYKTLKALKSHPGVSLITTGAGLRHGWNDDTRVLVNLKPGWFNMRHSVNVVIGTCAAEALAFFNSGDVREMAPELVTIVRAEPGLAGKCRAAYDSGQSSIDRPEGMPDETYETVAHLSGLDFVELLLCDTIGKNSALACLIMRETVGALIEDLHR